MYYQNYDEYIRSILGYPVLTSTNNQFMNMNASTYNYGYTENKPMYSQDIMNLYPEIYKIINPMVCKICESNTKPITKELVEQMTDEIYLNIETDNTFADMNIVNVRVNSENNNKNKNDTKVGNLNNSRKNQISYKSEKRNDNIKEKDISSLNNGNRIEEGARSTHKNPILRDLIKILILNQLLFGNSRHRYHLNQGFNQFTRNPANSENRVYYNY
jgi:hypothetical protein